MAAGIPIQIDVLAQTGPKGWSARIGCHSDDLCVRMEIEGFLKSLVFECRIVMNFVDGHAFQSVNHYPIKRIKSVQPLVAYFFFKIQKVIPVRLPSIFIMLF